MSEQEKRGPFRVDSSEVQYKNLWLSVREDRVTHDSGREGLFGVIEMVAGSTVLAMNHQNEVYLVNEYKYGMGGESLELMSGGLDAGESPLVAAQRELREELGFVAEDWMDLGVVKAFTTVMDSPNYMFMARGLETVERLNDDWEDLEIMKVPFELAVNMVMESKITHAASCVCIMKAKLLMDLMGPLE